MIKTIDEIIRIIKTNKRNFSIEKILKAYSFAEKIHQDQKRSSGDAYITHPLGVAAILLDIECDETMIIAALLHDTLEDSEKITPNDLKKEFGEEISNLVKGLTKIKKVEAFGLDRQVGSIRKMFLAMSKDIRVIYIKLADRLHNMSTIESCPLNKRKRIAKETLTIYVPLATRLGTYYFKDRLEELCFKNLYNKEYKDITKKLCNYNKKQERVAEYETSKLKEIIIKENIQFKEISYRVKQKYSIYRKMQKRNEDNIENIYDIFALRVITDTVENCYRILGIIHKYWTPLPNGIKDYIAVAKSNGYKSLHTTVIGLGKSGMAFKPIEIQIRTEEMHSEAERGAAAHWAYKEGISIGHDTQWIKSLVSLARDIQESNNDFLKNVTGDALDYRIFVLTPKGDIKDLPRNATPIDFAYSIHTDIGNHISTALVNGKAAPLDSFLKNGDIIDIKTNKNRSPNPAWINIVKTTNAKTSIKEWLKLQSREKLLKFGREEFNKFLKKLGKDQLDSDYSILKNYKKRNLSLDDRENIIKQIGEGKQKASDIIKNIFYVQYPQKNKLKKRPIKSPLTPDQEKEEVLVMGDVSFETRIASCCKPMTKDIITGFITRGGYVSVHKINCSFVQNTSQDRFIECHWASDELPFEVEFYFKVQNIIGITYKILHVFVECDINVLTIDLKTNKARNISSIFMLVEIHDIDKVSWIIEYINNIEHIIEADYVVKTNNA